MITYITCGGSWGYNPFLCRDTVRYRYLTWYKFNGLGFRLTKKLK